MSQQSPWRDVVPPEAVGFLDRMCRDVERSPADQLAVRIESLVARHEQWRARQCLNLNPAEGLISLRCRRLLDSDLATRLTEGIPGAKLYPHGRQNAFTDELEAIALAQACRQFGALYADWRPVSTSMAIAAVCFAVLRPGDVVLAQGLDNGGNYSYHRVGPAGLTGATIEDAAPHGTQFELDPDAIAEQVVRLRPKLIVVGGSNVLFPYPVRQLRRIADQVGALVLYDAAHLGLHISSGEFQKPLAEGADLVVTSTHKVMGGPVGGMVLTNDKRLAAAVLRLTFPGLLQTRDLNKYAALAFALTETAAFGKELCRQMLNNARALGAALEQEGCTVLAAARGYTNTHQLFLDLGSSAQQFESQCHKANILIADCALAGDVTRSRRSGIRLATHEITRAGMVESDMALVANLMARAVREREPEKIAADVQQLLRRFARIQYSFDASEPTTLPPEINTPPGSSAPAERV